MEGFFSQIPSFKHPWEEIKYILKMTTILIETQYYHIPSIRNGDAAKAARALVMLYFRVAQPTFPIVTACWCAL